MRTIEVTESPTLETVAVGDTVIIKETNGYWDEAKVVHVTEKYFVCGKTRYRKDNGVESTSYHSKNQAYHPFTVIEWHGGSTALEVCNEYQAKRRIELKKMNLRRYISGKLDIVSMDKLEEAAKVLGWNKLKGETP